MSDNRMYLSLLVETIAVVKSVMGDFDRYHATNNHLHLTSALTLIDLGVIRFNRMQEACDDGLEISSVRNRCNLASTAIDGSLSRINKASDLATRMLRKPETATAMDLLRIQSLMSTTLSVLTEVEWLMTSDLIEMYFLPNAG